MTEVFVLTHEYSDHSRFQICGVTDSRLVADAWQQGNHENHIYMVPINEIRAAHPYSQGWPELENA